ncbi:MAG: Precorrin-6Y C(5,15)-methyltransferase [decarboxylating] [Alphaproteobacteria bacterium MarineAlpha3_Bin5]|mgnify:CR=1 FL=1|nr:MAG: Precorrin-6Y C(5,15)-methyltransferase [decarboxylating] [Alphaproteobacteria bacterium MarineAlpha3_Bin5]
MTLQPSITVIGIGEDGLDGLDSAAQKRIREARLLVGGKRHLDLISKSSNQSRLIWGADFSSALPRLKEAKPKDRIVILATGDPLWFGVAERLIKELSSKVIEILPNVNAFSLAAARMRWSLSDPMVRTVSVHSRPFSGINSEIFHGHCLLVLSKNKKSPAELAALLSMRGFGKSRMTVLEKMGGLNERQTTGLARDNWDAHRFTNLNVVAIHCEKGKNVEEWSLSPGLPEEAYNHDGKITKSEIRSVTLSALRPMPGETFWDIGSGSGSVSIEWLRLYPSVHAFAFEKDKRQLARIKSNAQKLGVPRLKIIDGNVPGSLEKVDANPNKIFIGGGISEPGVIGECINRLVVNGRLVVNAVTIESKHQLLTTWKRYGGDLVNISTAYAGQIGRLNAFRPSMEVTQWRWKKN